MARQSTSTAPNRHGEVSRNRPTIPRLPAGPIWPQHLSSGWPPVWWVGCHGGAGTTTLARLTGLGIDAGTAWPTPQPGWPPVDTVLVCRATATGTWAAAGAVEQWRTHAAPPGVTVIGLVAVAASARRPPKIVTERLRLVGGWAPHVWRVGWVDAYIAADDPCDLGAEQPDVVALRHAVSQIVKGTQ